MAILFKPTDSRQLVTGCCMAIAKFYL